MLKDSELKRRFFNAAGNLHMGRSVKNTSKSARNIECVFNGNGELIGAHVPIAVYISADEAGLTLKGEPKEGR